MQVDVFKTNINNLQAANYITSIIASFMPSAKISFDLEDCDRILRIEGESLLPSKLIIQLFAQEGFSCQELE